MTQTVPATAVLGPGKTGLAIGLRVLDIDRVQYSAFSTTGVIETGTAGTYSKVGGVAVPDAGGYIVWGTTTLDLAETTVKGIVLTAQGIADAVNNLAPSGTGATGSIRAKLDGVKAITDNIDVSGVTYVPANNAGTFTITLGITFDETVTGLVIPSDLEKAYWTLKNSSDDDEAEALVQLVVSNPAEVDTDGLIRLNAVLWHEAVVDDPLTTEVDEESPEPFDRSLGALIINQPAGSARVYLTDELTVQLATAKRIGWDVKFIDSNGDSTGKRGVANLVRTETQTV